MNYAKFHLLLTDMGVGQKLIIYITLFPAKYLEKIKSNLAYCSFQQGHVSSAVVPGLLRTIFSNRKNITPSLKIRDFF